jgi:hypothetical protein
MSILAHDFLPRHKETEIFEAAKREPFGSPVDDENEARFFQKPWDSPVSSRILRDSLGTVPVFEIFEAGKISGRLLLHPGLLFKKCDGLSDAGHGGSCRTPAR